MSLSALLEGYFPVLKCSCLSEMTVAAPCLLLGMAVCREQGRRLQQRQSPGHG